MKNMKIYIPIPPRQYAGEKDAMDVPARTVRGGA